MDIAKPRRIRKIHGKSIRSIDIHWWGISWTHMVIFFTMKHGPLWYFMGAIMVISHPSADHSWPALIVQILWATPRHRWWPRLCEELPGSTFRCFEVFRCLIVPCLETWFSTLWIQTYWNLLKAKVIGWSNSSSVRIFYQPIQSQHGRISAPSTFRTNGLRRRVSAWANDDQKRTYSLLSHTYPLVI